MMSLKVRRDRVLPTHVSDLGAFVFVWVMIPLTFAYEVRIVSPALFGSQLSFLFVLHLTFGCFLLLNVLGNFIRLWLTDTSTRSLIVPSCSSSNCGSWSLCASCEAVQPPRAFHCAVCKVCMLKREHHCMFVGYCVGHLNHRFFFLFLFYTWLSVLYCTALNTAFLLIHLERITLDMMAKFLLPLLSLITFDLSWLQVYIFFWSVHFAALLLTSVLLIYHSHLLLRGLTTYENNVNRHIYDLGWRQNVREVLGNQWYWALFMPWSNSKLPHDGVQWDTKDTWTKDGPKNR